MELQRTLILLKPDALERGIIGEIITRFERVGAKIVGMKLLLSKRDTVERHYREELAQRRGKEIRERMIDMLISGPIVALVLGGVEIVDVARKMAGSTEPKVALPGTIRGDYSHLSFDYADVKKVGTFNLIHASATPEEAELEINVWFKPEELVTYKPAYTKFTLIED